MTMEQAADAREISWGRCTWQVRLMMANLARGGSRKQRGVAKQKREEGCALVFASPISTVYVQIK